MPAQKQNKLSWSALHYRESCRRKEAGKDLLYNVQNQPHGVCVGWIYSLCAGHGTCSSK